MNDELQQYISQLMHTHNNRPVADFSGYSPLEMGKLLYKTFEAGSPIELNTLTQEEYRQIPLLNHIRYLAEIIAEAGELKLTQKGNLPTKIVAALARREPAINERLRPVTDTLKEADSIPATLSRFMLDLCGISKKRNNKLSLTKAGEKLLGNEEELLRTVLQKYCYRFNWAYFDAYEVGPTGQQGFGFSLVLLSKWGEQQRQDQFYADSYFRAFPFLINESITPSYGSVQQYVSHAYSLRNFDRFGTYFGLVETTKERWDTDKLVKKTELFGKLIHCNPPAG